MYNLPATKWRRIKLVDPSKFIFVLSGFAVSLVVLFFIYLNAVVSLAVH